MWHGMIRFVFSKGTLASVYRTDWGQDRRWSDKLGGCCSPPRKQCSSGQDWGSDSGNGK